jgi:hypothetical protein
MALTLQLVFDNEDGKTRTLSVPYAKSGVTQAEVQTAMTALVGLPLFTPDLTGIRSASLVDRTVTEILGG